MSSKPQIPANNSHSRHLATKSHYSCAALPGAPWRSLALPGALWRSLVLSGALPCSSAFPAVSCIRNQYLLPLDNGESIFHVPGPLEIFIFSYQTIKNQYSCPALPGRPWDSLALSGALWCSLALSRVSQRSLPLPASEISICCPGQWRVNVLCHWATRHVYA